MTTSGPDGAVVEVEAIAAALVAAVIRPEDADDAHVAVQRVGPTDLAALVAVVDDHQPMTIEVVVDVLAELGCPPTAIADAVAADLDDVHVLLGIDPSPPPSALEDGPRVIDLGGTPPVGDGVAAAATRADRNAELRDEDGGTDHGTGGEPDPHDAADGADAVDGGLNEDDAEPHDVDLPADDDPPVVVIGGSDESPEVDTSDVGGLDSAGAAGRSTPGTTSDADTSAAVPGRRATWALVSFIVLVGAFMGLAVYLGAFG